MVDKKEVAAVASMLNACAKSMEMAVKRKDGKCFTIPCDIKTFVEAATSNPFFYTNRYNVMRISIRAEIDGSKYGVLYMSSKDAHLGTDIKEMTKEWNTISWAITTKHKNHLISEMSEWMCNVAKHDEDSWVSEDDTNLMHYIAWVCNHVCRDDRHNPKFWSNFGFTDAEVRRII